ncbi:MAG: LamG domain-containing protein [Phycisphaerae bacterium]
MSKKLIYFTSFVLVLSMGCSLAQGQEGLIGYWKFDESSGTIAADSTGGDNDGALIGDQLRWTAGWSAGALSFPGEPIDARVEFPTTGMSATAGTVAMWGYLFDPQPETQGRYFFGHTTQPQWANRVQIYMQEGTTPSRLLDIGLGNSHTRDTDIMELPLEEWLHVALTWDSGSYVVYVNGEEVSSGTYTGLSVIHPVANIGNDGSSAPYEAFCGLLDEVQLYDNALNSVEVLSAMQGQIWPYAWGPNPADGAKYVYPDVELSWSPGDGAQLHIVYFGDNFDDVNHDAGGFLLETTTYTPGPLELDKVYYWRINEFDGVVIHKGEVWSFRTIPEIDPNLIGGWKFDEGSGTIAYDSSGNGNDGTLEDGPTVVDGQFGQALAFEGSRVAIPASDSLTADLFQGSFTLSAWIKPRRTGGTWQQIFRSMIAADTSNDTLFINNDGRLSWRGRIGGSWAGGMCETASDVVPADQWTHVAVVGDGTSFRIYVNGALSQESAFRTTDGANATYYIGGDPTWIAESYSGMIDDVRIYNVALSAEEIEALAQ